MKLNIGPALKNEGAAVSFDQTVELGRLEYIGTVFDFKAPVRVSGRVRSIGDTLEISGAITGRYVSACDNCGKAVEGGLDIVIDETINSEAGDLDPECFVLSGVTLDISGLINSLVWENLPMRTLCREDCKGLCSICGQDLNEGVCNCDHTVYDPRLAILRERE